MAECKYATDSPDYEACPCGDAGRPPGPEHEKYLTEGPENLGDAVENIVLSASRPLTVEDVYARVNSRAAGDVDPRLVRRSIRNLANADRIDFDRHYYTVPPTLQEIKDAPAGEADSTPEDHTEYDPDFAV